MTERDVTEGNKVMSSSGWGKTNFSLFLAMQERIEWSSEKAAGSKQSTGGGSSHQTLVSCEMPCHRIRWMLAIYKESKGRLDNLKKSAEGHI